VGEPQARIAEDYLRILRFFRFHALYGDAAQGLDPEALAACAALADGLDGLSRERIGAEMRKLLAAPDPAPSVAAMDQSGILSRVLPGASSRALPVLIHLEDGRTSDWLRRLAVIGGADGVDRLRLSRAEAARLATLRDGVAMLRPPGELGYRHGVDLAADILLAHAALTETPLPDGWAESVSKGAEARFPVSAADLMPRLTGPALGRRLAELEAQWIASDFTLRRDDLL
jgi:poly(A) polymerase